MQKLNSNDYNLLSNNMIKILAQNRILTTLEFLQEDAEKLSKLTKLSLSEVLAVRNDIYKKNSAPLLVGTSLLIKSLVKKRSIGTGIHSLDAVTGGGIPIGYITEVYGLADSGKTQVCFQLAINCVKNTENTILYVDTKGDFSAIRIQNILEACGCTREEMTLILFKIRVVHIWTMDEIIELFKKLKNKLLVIENLSLIIIDSLACLMFQYLGDDTKVGLSFLNTLVNYSRFLCKELDIAIVCVNIQTRWVDQGVSDLEDGGELHASAFKDLYIEKRNRCLGNYWQPIPALVLLLEKSPDSNNEDNSSFSQVNVTVIRSSSAKSNQMCSLKIHCLGVT